MMVAFAFVYPYHVFETLTVSRSPSIRGGGCLLFLCSYVLYVLLYVCMFVCTRGEGICYSFVAMYRMFMFVCFTFSG